tara:strand:+ start:13 stop:1053 length:1041 start_codon:yes stop_codon:yes gene_type:complete
MNILITGGSGFIGSHLVCSLLKNTTHKIFNVDKLGYASDSTNIDRAIEYLNITDENRYNFLQIDLSDHQAVQKSIKKVDPDLIIHLAAESHVDKSITSPKNFIYSNIVGTFNLIDCCKTHWENLDIKRKDKFKFHHVSTDEVFGELGDNGKFNESSAYAPRSPYSASKAASDHLVLSWFYTYGFPVVISNCCNNYGPWQYPEKLIPISIYRALNNESINIYGNGKNVREWLHVEDHIKALSLIAFEAPIGETYCIGSGIEKTNEEIVNSICELLNKMKPKKDSYNKLIRYTKDRMGHDYRYSINSKKIQNDLQWSSSYSFDEGMKDTVSWYIKNQTWCEECFLKIN